MSPSPTPQEEGEDELISSPDIPPVRPPPRTSPRDDDPTSGITHIDLNDPNPRRPIITPTNKFNLRPPPSEHDDDEQVYSFPAFDDDDYDDDDEDSSHLSPLTYPHPDDPVVQALGVAASSATIANGLEEFSISHEDMRRYRSGAFVRVMCDSDGPVSLEELSRMTVSEAVWRKWEEVGGLAKGAGGLFRFAFDKHGRVYRPEMTHIQAIRLVIAASPRRMMTLAQIYQAIEERWPWHKTAGSTWKNSIRHNLSLNDCFVNAERPSNEGGSGKGGYWVVNDKLSGRTARKIKRGQLSHQEDLYTTTHQAYTPAHAEPITHVPHGYVADYTGRVVQAPKRPYVEEHDDNDSSSESDHLSLPSHSSKKSKAPGQPSSAAKKPRASNTVFPSIPIELPVRGSNWEPQEKVHRPFVRPAWDMPLDNPKGGLWNQTPVLGFGESREREVGRASGEGKVEGSGWTSSHPRVESRSNKHYDSPTYPTPNTSHPPPHFPPPSPPLVSHPQSRYRSRKASTPLPPIGVGLGLGLPGWDQPIPSAHPGHSPNSASSPRTAAPPHTHINPYSLPRPILSVSPSTLPTPQGGGPQTPLTPSHLFPSPTIVPHPAPSPSSTPILSMSQNQSQSLPPLTSVISKAHRDPASTRKKTREERREERERMDRRLERLRAERVAFQAAQAQAPQAQAQVQAQGRLGATDLGAGAGVGAREDGEDGEDGEKDKEMERWGERDEELDRAAKGVQGVELLALAAAEVRG